MRTDTDIGTDTDAVTDATQPHIPQMHHPLSLLFGHHASLQTVNRARATGNRRYHPRLRHRLLSGGIARSYLNTLTTTICPPALGPAT